MGVGKIKGGAAGGRGSHSCAKDAQEWGNLCDFGLRGIKIKIKIKIKINVKGSGRGRPLHMSVFHRGDGWMSQTF
jgi:hypothetical protein